MAAQASAVAEAKVTAVAVAAWRRPVSHSSGAKSSRVGWRAAATPTRTPPARCPWATKQPSRTSSTGMTLVWPSQRVLRTGKDSMSRLTATGAASSAVRRPTGRGSARAAISASATTSSRVPKVQPQPRVCSADRVSGLRTSPPNGVPVNSVES